MKIIDVVPMRSTYVNLYVLLIARVYGPYRVLDAGVIELVTGKRGSRTREWVGLHVTAG